MDPRRTAIVEAAERELTEFDIAHTRRSTDRYWASCGIAPAPDPADRDHGMWCGAFWLYCLHEAGVAPGVHWVPGLGVIAPQKLPQTKQPEPGDCAYTDKPWRHHAVVVDCTDGVLTTIDGNQPGIARRHRVVPPGMVFYSIAPLLGSTSSPPTPAPTKPPPSAPPGPEHGLIRGIDVSHHQAPSSINWSRLAESHRFVIARATYGTRPDETFAEHVKRALGAGMTVGAYAFFRPGQDAVDQLEAFADTVEPAGMGPGWLLPALDIEQNEPNDGPISAARYEPAEAICRGWRVRWGGGLIYTNPAMWAAVGSPGWLREYGLWISHYGVALPTTPLGLPWLLWQHKVAPLPGIAPGLIDQNVARTLPVIPASGVAKLPLEVDWGEFSRGRDAAVREDP